MLSQLINKQPAFFLNLCKTHKVSRLFAFGSSVHGPFNEKSDIDFVVDINETDPINKGELLMSFWDKLELFFNRKVDLLTLNSIKNPVLKKNIEQTQQLVYDGQKQEILL